MSDLKKLLSDVRQRAEAATEGPWDFDSCGDVWSNSVKRYDADMGIEVQKSVASSSYYTESNHDARFIAHSREDIPKLLQIIEVLAEACEFYSKATMPFPERLDDNEIYKYPVETDRDYFVGGKRARQAIQKANGIAKGEV